ncbi:putative transposase YbfD/YdcC, partial [Caulobacter sp. BE254]|nr:putative transposase YbfD/YdcC [Caulobacter sp. BE254]
RAPDGAEVKTTLDLLKGLSLKGCLVTADALHGHPAMPSDAQGRRPLGPEPQGRSAKAAGRRPGRLRRGRRQPARSPDLETRHGRRELRAASVLPPSWPPIPAEPTWFAIGRIQAERTKDGRTAASARYILPSRKLSPAKLAQVVRAHRKSPALDPGRGLR